MYLMKWPLSVCWNYFLTSISSQMHLTFLGSVFSCSLDCQIWSVSKVFGISIGLVPKIGNLTMMSLKSYTTMLCQERATTCNSLYNHLKHKITIFFPNSSSPPQPVLNNCIWQTNSLRQCRVDGYLVCQEHFQQLSTTHIFVLIFSSHFQKEIVSVKVKLLLQSYVKTVYK